MDLFVIFLCFLTFFHFSPLPHLLKNLNKKWYPLENLKICSKWGGIGWTPHWHLKWGVWGVKFYNTSKWGVYLPHFVFENGFETDSHRFENEAWGSRLFFWNVGTWWWWWSRWCVDCYSLRVNVGTWWWWWSRCLVWGNIAVSTPARVWRSV